MNPRYPSSVRILGGSPEPKSKLCSTNQVEPLYCPPVRKPRARSVPVAGRLAPVSSHPPGMRTPVPRLPHWLPSAEISNVVRQISGLAPPRNQVTVEPAEPRTWVAGSAQRYWVNQYYDPNRNVWVLGHWEERPGGPGYWQESRVWVQQ
ncbi:MAG: hypothetical protein NTV89_18900 [Proteobacteria bacterium]|nr:hypothetical protein [Pseudomonadota bacterium]